ncbi:uncharacterized protein LOC142525478 isoform X3 [Primulina tabacum]|uniref:uncharacterized protein LOC142525478 isoform X3 n=1 Tax=Primulina tabacum TaxID=48773 RepID=UPI003F5A2B8C
MAAMEEEPGIEVQIEHAVRSRLQHFKDQADSLTLESVRRLLEKDMGLEEFALDAHKRFIRQYLEKQQMDGPDNCDSKTLSDVDKDNHLSDKETALLPKQPETKKESTKSTPDDKEMMEDSPILGVLSSKSESGAQAFSLSESTIKKAIWERADHFLANSETITLVGVRRLLEEDLGLDKNTLDPFKKYINQQIDQVFNPPKGAKAAKGMKINSKSSRSKRSGKTSSEEGSDTLGGESDSMEDKVKSRKEAAHRENKKLEEVKKRKRSTVGDFDVSSAKQNKLAKRQKEEDNESDDAGNVSEDGDSKRKEKLAPGYGGKVEHLKSVIKACGMSVAPSIYKKAKQVSDEKREAFIVKELEGILLREGLSKDPSEREIKDCKKRKETAKELEGIDMSNIISSTRRRSTFSFVSPPKFETRAKGDKAGPKDIKNKEKIKKCQNDDNKEEGENKKEHEKVEKAKDEQTFEEEEGEEDEEVEDDDDEEAEEEEEEESEEFNGDNNEESD